MTNIPLSSSGGGLSSPRMRGSSIFSGFPIRSGMTVSLIIAFIFFSLFSYQSIKLYNAHRTRGDLTNFAQAMWNTTQGRVMQNTFNYSIHNFWGERNAIIPKTSNIFGIHFNPILFLFAPFYKLFPDPRTLLVVQSFFVACAGLLLYVIGSRFIKHSSILIILQCVFYLQAGVVSAVLSEFHAYTLSLFFGFLLVYSDAHCHPESGNAKDEGSFNFKGRILRFSQNDILYYLSLFLFLSIQENTGITAAAFGLLLLARRRSRIRGIVTVVLSVGYVLLATKVIIPALSNYHGYIFESIYGSRLGGTMFEIVKNGLFNPILLFSSLASMPNFLYVLKLTAWVFPFFLFSPLYFIVFLSGIAINLISQSELLKSITMHYESAAIPFLFIGTIHGISFFLARTRKYVPVKYATYKIPLFVVISVLVVLSVITYRKTTFFRFNPRLIVTPIYTSVDEELDKIVRMIPGGASVSTQDYISGHLSARRELYLFPVYANKSDYVLLSGPSQSSWPLTNDEHKSEIAKLKSYKEIYKSKNFILLLNGLSTVPTRQE